MIITEAYYLEHFGVRGQKWGVRNPERSAARQRNKELNKASRAKDRETHKKTVESARARIDSGRADQQMSRAEKAYKQNKKEIGSREARKILKKERDKYYKDIDTSMQAKDGKEAAQAILLGAALGVGMAFLSRA